MFSVQTRTLNFAFFEILGARLQDLQNRRAQIPMSSFQSAGFSRRDRGFLQSFLKIGGLKRTDHFRQVAFHEAIKIIERESDTVIGDAVLSVIVGPDFFFAATGPNLVSAMRRIFLFFLATFVLE